MEIHEAVALVRRHNLWRRGDDEYEKASPTELGIALDALCDHAERQLLGDPQEEPND